jgi:hypothetical protein
MVTIRVFEAAPPGDAAPAPGAVLLRALREDVDFRFVELAPGAGYEIAHEDGDVDGAGGALLVDAFEVAAEDDAPFLAAWRAEREQRSAARGYLGTRLHRAAGTDLLRWISLQRWSSPLMLQRVQRQHPPAVPFARHAALYQPVGRAP